MSVGALWRDNAELAVSGDHVFELPSVRVPVRLAQAPGWSVN